MIAKPHAVVNARAKSGEKNNMTRPKHNKTVDAMSTERFGRGCRVINIAIPFGQPEELERLLTGGLMRYGRVYTDAACSDGDCGGGSFRIHCLARGEQPDARYAILAALDLPQCARSLTPAYGTRLVIASDSRRLRRALLGCPCAAVCCGSAFSDTISLSSVGSGEVWLSVQRTLVPLTGETVEPCELPIRTDGGAFASMIAAGVLMMCGCPPENDGYALCL